MRNEKLEELSAPRIVLGSGMIQHVNQASGCIQRMNAAIKTCTWGSVKLRERGLVILCIRPKVGEV